MHDIGILPGGIYTAAEAINDRQPGRRLGYTNSSKTKASAFYFAEPLGHHLLATPRWRPNLRLGDQPRRASFRGPRNCPRHRYSRRPVEQLTPAHPTDLGTLPGGVNSYARGLNNALQVVGNADVP